MESQKGSLTIEASVALTAFMFIVVLVLSFATVYRAQSVVSHATLQTSQSLAVESYYRDKISNTGSGETLSMLVKFSTFLGFDAAGFDDAYAPLGDKGTNLQKIVRENFAYAIADEIDKADEILEGLGIPDGLDGVDFSLSAASGGDIIVNVQYKVKLPFSFFGERVISLSKSAKTKAFADLGKSQETTTPLGGSAGGGFR